MTRLLLALAVALALAGAASAQTNDPCPDCDPDGAPNEDNTYSSVDVGAVDADGHHEVLGDTDVAASNSDSRTFFGWLSLCFSAFFRHLADATGFEVDADAAVEAYVSDEGVDLDASVAHDGEVLLDFDESALGDADGLTWEAMGEVRDVTGLDVSGGPGHLVPGVDADVCIVTDVDVAGVC